MADLARPFSWRNCLPLPLMGRHGRAFGLAAFVVGAAVFSPAPASASLLGSLMQARYLYPTTSDVKVDDGAATVTPATSFNFANLVNVSFSSSTVTVTDLTPGAFATTPFDGLDLTVLSGAPITDAVEDPASSSAFAAGSVLSFSANDIKLNLAGTCATCVGGETIVIDVSTAAAVPEPASFGILASGLLLLGVKRRRVTSA